MIAKRAFARAGGDMPETFFLLTGRATATIAFFAYLLFNPCVVIADSLQPITWSRECPNGGERAEKLYQRGLDYQKSRNGTVMDRTKAAMFFESAIREGSAKAALAYGLMLRTSSVSPAEKTRTRLSVDLYKLGITMQCPEATHMLAEAYEHGWGVGESRSKATALYREAADKGSLVSMVVRAKIDKDDAEYWLAKALDKGYGYAGRPLSLIYLFDRRDAEKGIAVLRQGAALGSSDCLFSLAEIYRNGRHGQEKDPEYAKIIYSLWDAIDKAYEPKPIPDFDTLVPPKPILPYVRE